MMKTLYIDHHIIARETAGQPTNWQLLSELLTANGDWRLAVSECNLLEIAADGDKARAQRRATFIDSLRPVWMMERLDIQKCEVGAFLWRQNFNIDPVPFAVFYEHLSEITIRHSRPVIGETAASWVARADPNEIAEAKRLTVRSLRTLQAATTQQKRQIEGDVFRAWVEPKIPLRGPDGRLMTRQEREALADCCCVDRARFYRECPAMGVEHFACEARTQDPKRQPTQSDAIDLQHTVLGLSYCDALVTERYAFSTAAHARKVLAPLLLATLHKKLGPGVLITVRESARVQGGLVPIPEAAGARL